jgi:AraC-like DNA-binding protein
VELYVCDKNGVLAPKHNTSENKPIARCKSLRDRLIEKSDNQDIPVIYQKVFPVLFACLRDGEKYYLAGPMYVGRMDNIEKRKYCEYYHLDYNDEIQINVMPLSKVIALVELLAKILLGIELTDEKIISQNHRIEPSQIRLDDKSMEEFHTLDEQAERTHHTYQEERVLLSYVRDGIVEKALEQNMLIDADTGRLSQNDLEHWKRVVIVAITLCTRAAIEGGLPPSEAYKISDYYIRKSDDCKGIPALIKIRNQAVKELTQRVAIEKNKRKTSTYVEATKDYVGRHYREKIYLDDIADKMGINNSYLSKLFKAETGENLQDYIVRIRVEKAANLLTYSNESISYIAEYVNFPSQSYMGKMFKRYKNTSPNEYRKIHKPKEFN